MIEPQRHQLPLVLAAQQRIIDLMRHKARPAVTLGHGQRLHQVPAGEVRGRDVAHLALADKGVQRLLHLLDRRQRVEAVQVVNVHIIGAQAAQTGFERPPQTVARRARVVRPVAQAKGRFGRNQRPVAFALERLAQHLFRAALRVNVGSVEEVDAGLEAEVDHAAGLGNIGRAPRLEKLRSAAEGRGAETQCGNLEARASQKTIFHAKLDAAGGGRVQRDSLPDATGATTNEGGSTPTRRRSTTLEKWIQ